MVSLIFEVWPHPEHRQGYLDWAAELKNELVKMDGFISIEVMRDYGLEQRDQAPADSRRVHG